MVEFLLAAVAAICHAGIDRFPVRPSKLNGAVVVEPVCERGAVMPGAGAGLMLDVEIVGEDEMGVEADG